MGKVNKGTKKFIHKGGLSRQIGHRPLQKKLTEEKTNRLHKAIESDSRDKSQKAVENDFKKQLEMLVKQKKRMPGEDQVDFSDFLKGQFDDSDYEDVSDDDEGDLEFGDGGESLKGKKAKSKKSKGKKQEEEEEGDDDDEDDEDYGSEGEFEPEDFDEDMIETEGDELEEEEEREGGEGEEGEGEDKEGEQDSEGDDEEGEDGEGKMDKAARKKAIMAANLNKLMDDNEDLDDEVEAHRQQLQSLKDLDPSFFNYLAKEGTDVLDFDKLSKEMKEKKQTETGGIITVTSAILNGWIRKAVEDDSIEDIKKILTSFQVSAMTEDEAVESQMPFRIEKESVFNELIVFCLEGFTDIFYDLMEEDGKKARPATPTDIPSSKQVMINAMPGFAKIKKLVHIYSNVVFRLIDDSSDAVMLAFVIKNLVQFIPFIATSGSNTKRFLRSLLKVWSSSTIETRTSAYICVRQLTLYRPYPFINTVLRGIYMVFMQNSKSVNSAAVLEAIAFMRSCVVETYGMDFECSYQHMFSYMRQLAVTLQKGLVSPTQEHLSQVYSWQYLNALKLWADVLSQYPKQEQLQHLLYPVIQIIQGSITLDGSPKYYPYRVHLIRMLNTLATSNTSTFINSTPFCLDILGGGLMQSTLPLAKKKSVVDFKILRKAPEGILRTKQFQDELLNQVTELLATNLATYAYSVSFPELSTFVLKLVANCMTKMGGNANTTHLAQLVTSIEQNVQFIKRLRDKIDKPPKDITNGTTTFFSPTLKNNEKAPVVLFLAKFMKQVEKWESILNEKRKKLGKFENDSDDEAKQSGDDGETQNGVNGTNEDDEDDDEGEEEIEERPKKQKPKKEKKEKKDKKDKKRKVSPKLSEMTGDLDVSGEEAEQPKQKKVKTDKKPTQGTKPQNGASPKDKTKPKAKPEKSAKKPKK